MLKNLLTSSNRSDTSLVLLNPDILLPIFYFLANDPQNLIPLLLVCKTWYSIATYDPLWRDHINKNSHQQSQTNYYSLWTQDIHARKDTYYCVLCNYIPFLESPLEEQLKMVFKTRPNYTPYPIFKTLQEATDLPKELPTLHNENDSHTLIFVVQCSKVLLEKSPDPTASPFLAAFPADFNRVYEILYKPVNSQCKFQKIKIPFEEQAKFTAGFRHDDGEKNKNCCVII